MVRLTPNVSPFSLFAPTFVLLQALLSIGSYRHNNQCPHEVLAFAPTHNRFYSSAYISRISRTTVAFARRSPPSTSRETEKGSRTARDTKAARPGSARKQVEKGIKRKRISQANNPSTIDGNADPEEQRPTETLAGGPALIFAMARRMLVWDDESYVGQNDTYRDDDFGSGVPAPAAKSDTAASAKTASRAGILPRWHPHGGISDVNPSFRSTPPAMNSRGYAAAIRRNSRKRNKPASWRHALRTYYRMTSMEEEAGQEAPENMAGASTTNEDAPRIAARPRLAVRRSAPHYEGAIVACSKLGLWREAFRIYEEAAESKDGPSAQMAQASTGAARKHRRTVTDNMILGLVRAAVRGSKSLEMKSKDVEYRREPLDKVSNLLLNLEKLHGIPLDAMHVNPVAAAYQKLGLPKEAADLIQACLADRKTHVEMGKTALNVNDVQAKDRESYGILVRGGVADGDWAAAVDALSQMTEAGMYPTERQMTYWNETAEKREGRWPRRRCSKKRREQLWLQYCSRQSPVQEGPSSASNLASEMPSASTSTD